MLSHLLMFLAFRCRTEGAVGPFGFSSWFLDLLPGTVTHTLTLAAASKINGMLPKSIAQHGLDGECLMTNSRRSVLMSSDTSRMKSFS